VIPRGYVIIGRFPKERRIGRRGGGGEKWASTKVGLSLPLSLRCQREAAPYSVSAAFEATPIPTASAKESNAQKTEIYEKEKRKEKRKEKD